MSIQALNLVLEHQVGSWTKKAVLLCLANHCDTDWSTFVGQARIAAEMELAERTVRRALADLEEEGLIVRRARHRRRGRGRTSDYTTIIPAAIRALPRIAEPVDNPHDQPAPDAGESSTNRTETTTNRPHRPDQPAPGAGEPSENHQKNQATNRTDVPVETVGDHIHEFEVVTRLGDRDYRACRVCGFGPHAVATLGVEVTG